MQDKLAQPTDALKQIVAELLAEVHKQMVEGIPAKALKRIVAELPVAALKYMVMMSPVEIRKQIAAKLSEGKVTIDTLPNELLVKIIKHAYKRESTMRDAFYQAVEERYFLGRYALVNRNWAVIANSFMWKSPYLENNKMRFSFYRHITHPGYVCGKYVKELNLSFANLWPICIKKLLDACPNLILLDLSYYSHTGPRGYYDLWEYFRKSLPNLKKLNLTHNKIAVDNNRDYYFDNKEKLKALKVYRKNLEIIY